MKHTDDIENVLARTALTSVSPGSHRQRLKQQLVQHMKTKEKKMTARRIVLATRGMKTAAACAGTLLLVAGAWGASGVVSEVFNRFVFQEEPGIKKTLTRPNGTTSTLGSSTSFSVSSNDPDFTEADARQRHEGIKKAIDEGAAELIDTGVTETGTTVYRYKATLEDGQEVTWAANRRLYDPANLDAEMEQAIIERRGEVVDVVETDDNTVYIYKVILSDGSDRTYGSNVAPAEEGP